MPKCKIFVIVTIGLLRNYSFSDYTENYFVLRAFTQVDRDFPKGGELTYDSTSKIRNVKIERYCYCPHSYAHLYLFKVD